MERKKNVRSLVTADVQKKTDGALVSLFATEPETALLELSRRYQRYCYQIAYSVLKNREDAEECVSDVFLRCWERFPQRAPRCLRAYLAATARNLAITRYRRQRTGKRGGEAQTIPLYKELSVCSHRMEDAVCDSVLIRQCLEAFLDSCSSENRRLFWGYYVLGREVAALSGELSLTEACVRGRLYRMKLRFRRELSCWGLTPL